MFVFDVFKQFLLHRAAGSIVILWSGAHLAELILSGVSNIIMSSLATGFLLNILIIPLPFIVYGALVYMSARWYFGSDRSGFADGLLLGLVCGPSWFFLGAVENAIKFELDYGTSVQNVDIAGWCLLTAALAGYGAFREWILHRNTWVGQV